MQESRPNFLLFWLAVNAVGVLASAAYFIYLVVIYATEGAAPPKDSNAGTKVDSWSPETRNMKNTKIGHMYILYMAKRLWPGFMNAASKQVQTEVVIKSRNKIHQTWPKPFSRVLYIQPEEGL